MSVVCIYVSEETMPNPTQVRIERIESLIEWAKQTQPQSFDTIFKEVRDRYPLLSRRTQREYAAAVLSIMKRTGP